MLPFLKLPLRSIVDLDVIYHETKRLGTPVELNWDQVIPTCFQMGII